MNNIRKEVLEVFTSYRFDVIGEFYKGKTTYEDALTKTRIHFKDQKEHLEILNKYYDKETKEGSY